MWTSVKTILSRPQTVFRNPDKDKTSSSSREPDNGITTQLFLKAHKL